MILPVFFSSLLFASARLTPVDSARAKGVLLISDDGTTFFAYENGTTRSDRRNGKKIGAEILQVAVFNGQPPHVESRTTSQGLYGVEGSGAIFNGHQPTLIADAANCDHLLVATDASLTQRRYIAITEFDFRSRGPHPNKNWLIVCNREARLADLRYGPEGAVVAWTWKKALTGVSLSRYEGQRTRPGILMRRTATLSARLPAASLTDPVTVSGYDASRKAYTLGLKWGGRDPIRLVSLSGKVLRTMP